MATKDNDAETRREVSFRAEHNGGTVTAPSFILGEDTTKQFSIKRPRTSERASRAGSEKYKLILLFPLFAQRVILNFRSETVSKWIKQSVVIVLLY